MSGRFDRSAPLGRREFSMALAAATVGATCLNLTRASTLRPAEDAVDHIILAHPDLEAGIAYVFEKTGVRAVLSGVHPGRGTRNALAALGGRRYLEVIGLDPAQSVTNEMVSGLKTLTKPMLIGWAMGSDDLVKLRSGAEHAKLQPSEISPGSRVTPSGATLEWETVNLGVQVDGLMPFAIRWKNPDVHPSTTSPSGLKLTAIWFEHPEPSKLKDALAALGLSARIDKAASPRIRVTVSCAKGDIEL